MKAISINCSRRQQDFNSFQTNFNYENSFHVDPSWVPTLTSSRTDFKSRHHHGPHITESTLHRIVRKVIDFHPHAYNPLGTMFRILSFRSTCNEPSPSTSSSVVGVLLKKTICIVITSITMGFWISSSRKLVWDTFQHRGWWWWKSAW